ncbi:helix-turn-helix domain-containing protein [Staphylococcus sp. GSSP0090]|nr:helix-turn-helix domain-containing protein [Staphylococcus sp. GSSP0090]
MNFATQIKMIRKEHQLTQAQFANQLNISRQTVSAWENNRYLPDIEMIVEIAKTFNLSLDDLILGNTVVKDKLVNDTKFVKRIRLSILSLIFIIIAIVSALLFTHLPSHVSQDGVLQEPWFLVVLAFFSLLTGLIIGLVNLVLIFLHSFNHRRQKN